MTICQHEQLDIQLAILGTSVNAFHKDTCQQTQRVKIALLNKNQWGDFMQNARHSYIDFTTFH